MDTPHLAKASDIEEWADKIDARSDFPELIRRLVLATANPSSIEFRAQEGTDYSGWDGRVETEEGTAHVPKGRSGWEMGVGQNPKRKATDDYDKRTKDPTPFTPAKDTFVFCTPRRWASKGDWADSRREEGEWKDVRTYDAEDLEAWLTAAPGVHVWFSLKIGIPAGGVEDLLTWWRNWRSGTSPELTSDILLSGRSDHQDRLLVRIQSESAITSIRGESPEEARAFIAAAFASQGDPDRGELIGRTLIVETKEAWRYFAKQDSSLVLIPKFRDHALFRSATQNGHHVLVPVGREYRQSPDIQIPRLSVVPAREHFEGAGISTPKARSLAGLLRRSLPAFRRVTAEIPPEEPDWASGDHGSSLVPLVLAGRWNQGKEGDMDAVSSLAQESYDDVRRNLNKWRNTPEPPFRQTGSQWQVNAKEVAWRLLRHCLKKDSLDTGRFCLTDSIARDGSTTL